jgi:hypothetical protein
LSRNKQLLIGKYHEANPEASKKEIQLHFVVTYNQVIHAIKNFESGKLHRKPVALQQSRKAETRQRKYTAEEMLENQFHLAVAGLDVDTKMQTDTRITLLEKLVNMRKRFQSMQLESHIKRTDAALIALIVRKFKPEATDDDVVKIYKEALELWKQQ